MTVSVTTKTTTDSYLKPSARKFVTLPFLDGFPSNKVQREGNGMCHLAYASLCAYGRPAAAQEPRKFARREKLCMTHVQISNVFFSSAHMVA